MSQGRQRVDKIGTNLAERLIYPGIALVRVVLGLGGSSLVGSGSDGVSTPVSTIKAFVSAETKIDSRENELTKGCTGRVIVTQIRFNVSGDERAIGG